MKMMKVLIVEDEPLSQQVLEKYIAQHPSLHLVSTCNNAFEAQAVLNREPVDLIFLDINLPQVSGINFLRSLTRAPRVIFTTAYPEHALEGFELDVIDYLLKPFSFERFLKAVNKALVVNKNENGANPGHLFIKADKKVFRIEVNEILDLEALGDYVRIRTVNNSYLVNQTLKELLEELPAENFHRVHKSFAIALNKISFIEGNFIRVGEKDIPIGATYREKLLTLVSRK